MHRLRRPDPVLLVCGLLAADTDVLRRAVQLLGRKYGVATAESGRDRATACDRYAAEMGSGLIRRFVVFENPIQVADLPGIKIDTAEIETRMADDHFGLEIARPVNIDPGYLDIEKLVTAASRDRAHRIHLELGVYGELSLMRDGDGWRGLPWTHPDYIHREATELFEAGRTRLIANRETDAEFPDKGSAPP